MRIVMKAFFIELESRPMIHLDVRPKSYPLLLFFLIKSKFLFFSKSIKIF